MPRDNHIEPSIHSTPEVDEFLERRDETTDEMGGPGAPIIKPNKNLDDDGKASTDEPKNPRT